MRTRQSSKKKVRNANSQEKIEPDDQINAGSPYDRKIIIISDQIRDEENNYNYFLSLNKFLMVESSSRKMQYLRKEIEAVEFARGNTLTNVIGKLVEIKKQISRYTKLIEPLAMNEPDSSVLVSTSLRQMNTGVRLFSHYRLLLISYKRALSSCLITRKI